MTRPAPRSKKPPRTGPRTAAAVLVRLTDEEKAELDAAAARTGVGVGPWLRMLGLTAARAKGDR